MLQASCHKVFSSPTVPLDNNNDELTSNCHVTTYVNADPILTLLNSFQEAKCSDTSRDVTHSSDPEPEYKCPCGRKFKCKAPYQRHMDLAHSDSPQSSYRCDVCLKTFGNLNTLTMHMSVHGHNKQSSLATLARHRNSRYSGLNSVHEATHGKHVIRPTKTSIRASAYSNNDFAERKTIAKMDMKSELVAERIVNDVSEVMDISSNTDVSSLLNNNEPKLVTLENDASLCDSVPHVTATVEVSSESTDNKEESDKENVNEHSTSSQTTAAAQASEDGMIYALPTNPAVSYQHVVIKVQKETYAPSGTVTSGGMSPQTVTIPPGDVQPEHSSHVQLCSDGSGV